MNNSYFKQWWVNYLVLPALWFVVGIILRPIITGVKWLLFGGLFIVLVVVIIVNRTAAWNMMSYIGRVLYGK